MPDLNKLIAGHAYWSDKKRELKERGAYEAGLCEGLDTCEDNHNQIVSFGTTCIDKAIEQMQERNKDIGGNGYNFELIWEGMIEEDEVCQHCINVRSLKKERVNASRKLGAIRAAITRVGRNIDYKVDNA